ncbi:MAG: histidine phosphotransferase family protein [Planktomarina sp.]
MTKSPDITALVATRMCHDFANPLGAIGNGLELLELSGIPLGEEGALLHDSLTAAKARLTIFRMSFGNHSDKAMLGPAEVTKLQAAWNVDSRLKIQLPNMELSKIELQKMVLMLQCVETALPAGGAAQVSQAGPGFMILAEGRRVNFDPQTWGVFDKTDLTVDLEPKQVQFAILAKMGIRPVVRTTDTALSLSY